jgi:acetoin utilization deacetylase AcuC-like enzyme
MIIRVYDERMLAHGVPWHPENAGRLAAITARLEEAGLWTEMLPLQFEPATASQLLWVHEDWYLEELEAASRGGGETIDPDTIATEATWEAAGLAAGGCIGAAEALMAGADLQALCLVRPPGHHALAGRAMGFCFLNNAALAAEAALRSGAERVAIFDFDAHHGNGLQEIFYSRGDVLYASIHERGIFPGSGTVDELGLDAGLGLNVNVPLPDGARGEHYLRAWDELLGPLLRRYQPDLLILDAGYDAHWRDPLTGMGLTADDFHALTARAKALADEVSAGRVQVILEGGYDPQALALSVESTMLALMGEPIGEADEAPPPLHELQAGRLEQFLAHGLGQHKERLGL